MPVKTKRRVRKTNKRNASYGTANRAPSPLGVTQVPRAMKVGAHVISRTFTTIFNLQPMTSTYLNILVFMYQPFFASYINAGTISLANNFATSGSFVDMIATARFYKVKKISFRIQSKISTTIAASQCNIVMDPELTPNVFGATSAFAQLEAYSTLAIYDPHFSTCYRYLIPETTKFGNQNDNQIIGGWLPTTLYLAGNQPTNATAGGIAFAMGDPGDPLIPNQIYGFINVTYEVLFKLLI